MRAPDWESGRHERKEAAVSDCCRERFAEYDSCYVSFLTSGRRVLSAQSWNERPLSVAHIEYASTQLAHLRLLATNMLPQTITSTNILRESNRYAKLWHQQRRNRSNPYKAHNYLPQGIIERTEEESSLKLLGTRKCRGCERNLYQESFQIDFRRFARNLEKQFCYTCAKVNLRRYRRTRFLDIMELAKSRTSSPALATETKA